jgi:hypothetical protein
MTLGTFTKVSSFTEANKRVRVFDVQLSSGANYPTGGDTISPSVVGLRKIEEAIPHGIARATSGGATGRALAFDYATTAGSVKMQVYTTGSAEAANNSDQSTQSCRITFRGP